MAAKSTSTQSISSMSPASVLASLMLFSPMMISPMMPVPTRASAETATQERNPPDPTEILLRRIAVMHLYLHRDLPVFLRLFLQLLHLLLQLLNLILQQSDLLLLRFQTPVFLQFLVAGRQCTIRPKVYPPWAVDIRISTDKACRGAVKRTQG